MVERKLSSPSGRLAPVEKVLRTVLDSGPRITGVDPMFGRNLDVDMEATDSVPGVPGETPTGLPWICDV